MGRDQQEQLGLDDEVEVWIETRACRRRLRRGTRQEYAPTRAMRTYSSRKLTPIDEWEDEAAAMLDDVEYDTDLG